MSDKTGIEWTEATWNPVTGCTKVSQGCKHCYAERDWGRMAKVPAYIGRKFTDVRWHYDRLEIPSRWKKPRLIFVNSMSDLFHESVPFDFILQVFEVMIEADWHTYQILTKRPERMLEFVNWCCSEIPDFIWIGVSVEDQATADERIPLLLQTPAAVRWISAEPLLGPVDLRFTNGLVHGCDAADYLLDWVVVGGESGPNARPMHPDWARSLRDQCAAAEVPFLFKQWGMWTTPESATSSPFFKTMNAVKGNIVFDGQRMIAASKNITGRLLDGVEHNGYPTV
ncbi:DUF5131 family protein [Methylomonas sp. 2BW1-5-20]|uniref:DUF5131 family protein n=1 Tax=Methylomonas sp. 2BW1-5-20 TaxID=3376686 RepID=UPI0040508727